MVFIRLTCVLLHLHLVLVGRHSDGSREGTWWRGGGKEKCGWEQLRTQYRLSSIRGQGELGKVLNIVRQLREENA